MFQGIQIGFHRSVVDTQELVGGCHHVDTVWLALRAFLVHELVDRLIHWGTLQEDAHHQLKAIYKDNADTIIGNMDTSIFLGGKEPTTLKELAAVLGKETIDTYNTGESRGRETSHSLNYQKLGKELMSQDELAVMDGGKCILQLRGVRPFLSDKYDITRHPNFKYTADADKRNTFDIEAFLSARLKLKPDEVCDVYEVDTEGV